MLGEDPARFDLGPGDEDGDESDEYGHGDESVLG